MQGRCVCNETVHRDVFPADGVGKQRSPHELICAADSCGAAITYPFHSEYPLPVAGAAVCEHGYFDDSYFTAISIANTVYSQRM